MPKAKLKSITPGLTKGRLTNKSSRKKGASNSVNLIIANKKYRVPSRVAFQLERKLEKHLVEDESEAISKKQFFQDEFKGKSPGAVNLRGLRYREDLTQVAFAKKFGVTQANLSAMENGKRSIGKEIAKRIGKEFGMDYRLFL